MSDNTQDERLQNLIDSTMTSLVQVLDRLDEANRWESTDSTLRLSEVAMNLSATIGNLRTAE
jgi:hypothetical protein